MKIWGSRVKHERLRQRGRDPHQPFLGKPCAAGSLQVLGAENGPAAWGSRSLSPEGLLCPPPPSPHRRSDRPRASYHSWGHLFLGRPGHMSHPRFSHWGRLRVASSEHFRRNQFWFLPCFLGYPWCSPPYWVKCPPRKNRPRHGL